MVPALSMGTLSAAEKESLGTRASTPWTPGDRQVRRTRLQLGLVVIGLLSKYETKHNVRVK